MKKLFFNIQSEKIKAELFGFFLSFSGEKIPTGKIWLYIYINLIKNLRKTDFMI